MANTIPRLPLYGTLGAPEQQKFFPLTEEDDLIDTRTESTGSTPETPREPDGTHKNANQSMEFEGYRPNFGCCTSTLISIGSIWWSLFTCCGACGCHEDEEKTPLIKE